VFASREPAACPYESALFDRVRDDDFVAAVDAMRAGLWERVLRETL
jgi:hypothetical protein